MIVAHNQNKTLFNKVFFVANFMNLLKKISCIYRTHPKFNNVNYLDLYVVNYVVLYGTKDTAINYFVICKAVRYSFIHFNIKPVTQLQTCQFNMNAPIIFHRNIKKKYLLKYCVSCQGQCNSNNKTATFFEEPF